MDNEFDKYAFDPARLIPAIPRLIHRWRYWRTLAVLVAVGVLLLVLAAEAEGRLGTLSDFRPWLDARRIAGDTTVGPGRPSFPLLRDYPSFILLIVAASTLVLVPWQWRLLSDAVPSAVAARAIIPRVLPDGTDLLVEHAARVNRFLDLLAQRRAHIVIFVGSAGLATLLVLGADSSDLFAILVPDGLTPRERSRWLDDIYSSWWASTSHPTGAVTYGVITTLTLYVVTLQNIAGLAAIWFIWQLPRSAVFRERPFATTGNDGWEGMAVAYRTVYFSLSLHGVAITLIVVVMGVQVTWVAALILAWVVVAPLYLWLPRQVFRRGLLQGRAEEAERLKELTRPAYARRYQSFITYQNFAWTRDELQKLETLPVAPLRMGRARVVSIGITAFSLVAAAVQTWFAWQAT